ncbi:M23 family metallopeptidase [Clostridium carnis]
MVTKSDSVSIIKKIKSSIMLTVFLFIVIGGKGLNVKAYTNYNSTQKFESNVKGSYINENKVEVKSQNVENKNTFFQGVLTALTGKTYVNELILSGETLGYISQDYKVNDVLSYVLKIYIDNENINKDKIVSADIKGNIGSEYKRIDAGTINSIEEVAQKIYNEYKKNKDIVEVTLVLRERSTEKILPTTLIINDENLYTGETKEYPGAVGVKDVLKEVTYKNNNIVDSKIIEEKVIKEAKSKEIHRGKKNPYIDGVAFLKSPTRGGDMTSGYGERWNSFHKGIDIAGNIGDDVIAAMDGEIIYSEFNNGGYGNLIKIKHDNDMVTYYAHLNKSYVKVGDKIKKGDIIGEIGNTGFSTGPHLHFELRVNDKPVNPVNFIVKK